MLTDVVKRGQGETSTEGLIPLPGDASPRTQGGVGSSRRRLGAGADRVMAPGARALSLTERMALGRCVAKSRIWGVEMILDYSNVPQYNHQVPIQEGRVVRVTERCGKRNGGKEDKMIPCLL